MADGIPGMLKEFRAMTRIEFSNANSTDRPVEVADLRFSGAVYIYHQMPILMSDQDALRETWKSKGYSVQFRGPDYAYRAANPVVHSPAKVGN